MNDFLRQDRHRVRFDWGRQGAAAVTVSADVAVVIDVLSFTTTLTVALDRGTTVLPYRWNDGGAADYARQHDAVLAVGRSEATMAQISLSPGTVRSASPPARLVLPSPNGSTIAHDLAEKCVTCVGASLRNASAVAEWISHHHEPATATVAVIAAGERWPDGSLRPAVEDLWGAGAVIAALHTHGWPTGSPEAEAAAAAWQGTSTDVASALFASVSGRELTEQGYAEDVTIAAEVDRSRSVPLLRNHRFVDGRCSA